VTARDSDPTLPPASAHVTRAEMVERLIEEAEQGGVQRFIPAGAEQSDSRPQRQGQRPMMIFLLRVLTGVLLVTGLTDVGAEPGSLLGPALVVSGLMFLLVEQRLVRERELDALRQELQRYARKQGKDAHSRSVTFTREFTTNHYQAKQ
jgi:hypothetical protein